MSSLLQGELDEAAQPVGTSKQTRDVDRRLLYRIVARCLKTHRATNIPAWRSLIEGCRGDGHTACSATTEGVEDGMAAEDSQRPGPPSPV
jgi:hypothetical protein